MRTVTGEGLVNYIAMSSTMCNAVSQRGRSSLPPLFYFVFYARRDELSLTEITFHLTQGQRGSVCNLAFHCPLIGINNSAFKWDLVRGVEED